MATEDQTPQLIPPVPLPPTLGLNIADPTVPTVTIEDTTIVPIGKSWAFDIPGEAWLRGAGKGPLPIFGPATLLMWVDKCIHTQRGALPIHPPEFGMEDPLAIFGRPVSELSEDDLERQFSEALTFHPRISGIANLMLVDSDPESDGAYVVFQIITDPPVDDAQLLTQRVFLGDWSSF